MNLFKREVIILRFDTFTEIDLVFPTSSVIKELRSAMSVSKNEPDVPDKYSCC